MAKIIVVGSGTGLKPLCVKDVFEEYDVMGISVSSDVNEQPIGYQEIIQGALNRAFKALEKQPDALYSFGIENGLINDVEKGWIDLACIVCICNYDKHKMIIKWTDSVNVPNKWVGLLESNYSITYAKLAKDKFDSLKDMDVRDPHIYLTNGKKSRKMFLIETIKMIKSELS